MLWIGDSVRLKYIQKHIPKGAGKCLDLGAGAGIYKETVKKAGYEYVGLDPEPRAPDMIKGVAEDLPFKDNEFDLVICIDVLEHLKDEKIPMREVFRVMKYGGTLLLHTPNSEQVHPLANPKDNPKHERFGYTEYGLRELLSQFFVKTEILPTFNLQEAIAWDLAYMAFNEKKVSVLELCEKLSNFNEQEFNNLGWLCLCKK